MKKTLLKPKNQVFGKVSLYVKETTNSGSGTCVNAGAYICANKGNGGQCVNRQGGTCTTKNGSISL